MGPPEGGDAWAVMGGSGRSIDRDCVHVGVLRVGFVGARGGLLDPSVPNAPSEAAVSAA